MVFQALGVMVLHCVSISLVSCNSFSSPSLDHSDFLMLGSSHSHHLALHCSAAFLCMQQRGNPRPPVFPIFHNCCFQNLISVFLQCPAPFGHKLRHFDGGVAQQADKRSFKKVVRGLQPQDTKKPNPPRVSFCLEEMRYFLV